MNVNNRQVELYLQKHPTATLQDFYEYLNAEDIAQAERDAQNATAAEKDFRNNYCGRCVKIEFGEKSALFLSSIPKEAYHTPIPVESISVVVTASEVKAIISTTKVSYEFLKHPMYPIKDGKYAIGKSKALPNMVYDNVKTEVREVAEQFKDLLNNTK